MALVIQLKEMATSAAANTAINQPDLEGESPNGKAQTQTNNVHSPKVTRSARDRPLHQRVCFTVLVALVGGIVSWAGSITSAAAKNASEDFGVTETVESLAAGLYFVGFGLGSLVAGPLSETFGRNVVYIGALSLFMVFIAVSGAAPNIGVQLAFRFLAGFFGNVPLTCAGGSLADLWSPQERTTVVPVYSVAIFDGSTLGPVVGGWIAYGADAGRLSWRWVEWTTLIMSAVLLLLIVFLLPETYSPILLQWKVYYEKKHDADSSSQAIDQAPLSQRLKIAIQRPFAFLIKEPIVFAIAMYLTLVYTVFFTFLNGIPSIFKTSYSWNAGLVGTSFLSIFIGQHLPLAVIPLTARRAAAYTARLKANGAQELDPPENRLWMAMLGAVALPISLFSLGWTANLAVSYWWALGAGVLFGFSSLAVYIGFYMYVVDVYAEYAASGLASTTVLRYVVAGAMIPPSIPMYRQLGHHWTLTLFGTMSALMGVLPFVFFFYGPYLRQKSPVARKSMLVQNNLVDIIVKWYFSNSESNNRMHLADIISI